MTTCIPLFRPGNDVTGTTTTVVVAKTFVGLTGALSGGNPKIGTATAGARPFGVAVRNSDIGQNVAVIRGTGTILPVISGAAITHGVDLEVDAQGRVIPLASGTAVGRALDTAATGADVFIELY